jgi:uncharacterized membrane protein YfcA
MTLLEIFGIAGALIIGISLGMIGGGGSILTVPVLVYLLHVEPVLATAYSLFIVGLTSLIGSISHARHGNIHYKTAIVFALPSFAAVYLTRWLIVPSLPLEWFTIGGMTITRDTGILILFALLMLFASVSMIRDSRNDTHNETGGEVSFNIPFILLEGTVVGILTGLVGAGGGFLIIPALVLFARLPMKMAVGTSLLIIAAKSLLGFLGDIQADQNIDWTFMLGFSALSVVGIIIGAQLAKKVDGEKLKKAFGWFVLAMGLYMMVRELYML